ncbi:MULTISPECIES: 3-hydroxyacyl-ACP dehydratase FabZ [Thiothrix]|jgi:3-hydroxyacyl-[acyl-carrier-protein] dehydratase|uniref:3-hydroxyacyl-[acyl-carrier-protein] dehydratase FabZ n=2 Tax=Thiothrix TaxID=1030 RepID=A0A975IFM6_9GAMM|nr:MULTISPECIES: 3-hydroxyacyl-ACP dehydratase FabZ [Thiothrix]MDX9989387.1 3-hydroxyacyl-ACP dehydratase FabZ [Thiothrix unzii]OQX08349.1 MAG: 3-hydroxyacyl-[acyl-carrier-protein] dehydratase FabZ [Thiothrix lacustris]QTR51981.1 3-hydroxyacyl-ACP dehydratase FabZ [Thiothrix unzii]
MGTMNVEQIRNYLPHRYPFLLVDRVVEYEVGKSLTAIKNVTVNEPWVNGHFPHQPIMPGVLIIEALAQATGLLGFRTMGEEPQTDTLYLLVAVDNARFKQAVVPGDQLVMQVELVKRKGIMWVFKAEARVDGKLAVSAELMCAAKKEKVA